MPRLRYPICYWGIVALCAATWLGPGICMNVPLSWTHRGKTRSVVLPCVAGVNKHPPGPSQEGNLRSPLLGGDFVVSSVERLRGGEKVVGFLSFKTQPNLMYRNFK